MRFQKASAAEPRAKLEIMRGKLGLVLGVALGVTWSTAASAQQAPVAAFPIESPAAVEKPAPEPLPKPEQPEQPEQPAVRTAIVGLRALEHDAELQSNWQPSGTASDWYVICMAPCTRRVPGRRDVSRGG
jgi:hypothetical protein